MIQYFFSQNIKNMIKTSAKLLCSRLKMDVNIIVLTETSKIQKSSVNYINRCHCIYEYKYGDVINVMG